MPARRSMGRKPPFDVAALWAVKRIGAPTLAPDPPGTTGATGVQAASQSARTTSRDARSIRPWVAPLGGGRFTRE